MRVSLHSPLTMLLHSDYHALSIWLINRYILGLALLASRLCLIPNSGLRAQYYWCGSYWLALLNLILIFILQIQFFFRKNIHFWITGMNIKKGMEFRNILSKNINKLSTYNKYHYNLYNSKTGNLKAIRWQAYCTDNDL